MIEKKEKKRGRGRPRSNQTLEERLKRLTENAKRYYHKKKKLNEESIENNHK